MDNTCATCKYFHEMPGYGKCRAKSPSCDGWPSVTSDCWCGEHSSVAQLETNRACDAANLAEYRKMNAEKNDLIKRILSALVQKSGAIDLEVVNFIDELKSIDEDAVGA